jgi:hypothetical protein
MSESLESFYLGISLKLGENISYTVIELKSKIDLLNKYKILLIAFFYYYCTYICGTGLVTVFSFYISNLFNHYVVNNQR